ncbi:MAG: glycosyltransferase family 39 protein [Candidatus Moraniibacteriota bacterium]
MKILFSEKIKLVPRHFWVLALILLVGIFLRTYNFHSWLKFSNDQARDAFVSSQAAAGETAWPLAGPYMSYSGDGDHVEENSFHLGPVYYYFQIISAKIFGNYADKLAYPDVFFGVLSIVLLYAFLRIYFEINLSLGLSGLYAISAYFVQYSRFAWNTNLIPFFVLLLLFCLHKFLAQNEKTHWSWVILLGVALGVGFQLHAIVMVLFAMVAFLVFLFSMKKNYHAWKRWMVVLLIFCALNAPQIFSELKTDFSNTKAFFSFSSHNKESFVTLLRNDIDCHIEANAHFLSPYGSSNCTYDFLTPMTYGHIRMGTWSKLFQDLLFNVYMLVAIAFSLLGYFLLLKFGKNESKSSQKYFLQLVALYLISSFVVMFSLSVDKFNDLRYYTPTFFAPYILLGFLFEFFRKKIQRRQFIWAVVIFSGLLIFTNIQAIGEMLGPLLAKDRTCSSRSITLGELEPVADYMLLDSKGKKLIYFGGEKALRAIYVPVEYILKKHGVDAQRIGVDPALAPNNDPTYMLSCASGMKDTYPYKKIGSLYVFRLDN